MIGTSLGTQYQDMMDMHLQLNIRDNNVIKPDDTHDSLDNNEVTPQHLMNTMRDNADPRNIFNDAGDVVDYDETPAYTTRLSPADQSIYNSRFKPEDSQDYDMQGWFAANPNSLPNSPGVHYPDTFKKPNHMTFSDESQYNGINGNQGGHWGTEDGKDTFTPGPTNLANHSIQEMKDYFARVEPNVKLILPDQK